MIAAPHHPSPVQQEIDHLYIYLGVGIILIGITLGVIVLQLYMTWHHDKKYWRAAHEFFDARHDQIHAERDAEIEAEAQRMLDSINTKLNGKRPAAIPVDTVTEIRPIDHPGPQQTIPAYIETRPKGRHSK